MKLKYSIAAVAFTATLLIPLAQADVTGDPEKAVPIVTTLCFACHGPEGQSVAPNFPNLAGQQPDYILKQLKDFKNNKRQNDIMSPNVANLSEDDMGNLALFFSKKKVVADPAGDPALIAKGKKVFEEGDTTSGVPACSGCHGPAGTGSSNYPRIASQHVDYILEQLKQFAAGNRKNDKHLMQAIASRLTEDEIKAVAQYVSSLP